jgi:two-component system alkaline phosphatase synthesis response regulator PhoP
VNRVRRILIADDEPFIVALLKETLEELEDEGVEILAAGNGVEGWAIIQDKRPSLIFLDVMMPKMSGYQVCQLVKQDPELSKAYVVMLTAKGQEIDRERGTEAGADEYVTKPFDPDYILERAHGVLSRA